MQGKTSSGFKFKCDDRIMTDWRFTMAASKTQKGDGLDRLNAANEMLMLALGSDGYEALLKYVADKNDGFVPSDALMTEFKDILTSIKETKN